MERDWFTEWSAFLGHSTLNAELAILLNEMGAEDIPKVPRKAFSTDLYINGMCLTFEDAEAYPDHAEMGGSGVGVLHSVVVLVDLGKDLYTGPLPFGLERKDNRERVSQKLGPPDESNDIMDYDSWFKDGRILQVRFTSDDAAAGIAAISLHIKTPT